MKKGMVVLLCLFSFWGCYSYDLVVNSVQKCGTNLTIKLLRLLTDLSPRELAPNRIKYESDLPHLRPNQYYLLHHYPALDHYLEIFSRSRFKGIFIQRDPRDGFVSLLHFISKVTAFGKISKLSFNQLFDLKVGVYFDTMTSHFPWTLVPNFLTIRFEDVIGSRGGGSDIVQRQTIMAIANHLEIEITPEKINYVTKNLFAGTWTFRKGQIGAWKTDLSDEQKSKMYPYAVEAVQAFGYEY